LETCPERKFFIAILKLSPNYIIHVGSKYFIYEYAFALVWMERKNSMKDRFAYFLAFVLFGKSTTRPPLNPHFIAADVIISIFEIKWRIRKKVPDEHFQDKIGKLLSLLVRDNYIEIEKI
jgi:hypothetical protein